MAANRSTDKEDVAETVSLEQIFRKFAFWGFGHMC